MNGVGGRDCIRAACPQTRLLRIPCCRQPVTTGKEKKVDHKTLVWQYSLSHVGNNSVCLICCCAKEIITQGIAPSSKGFYCAIAARYASAAETLSQITSNLIWAPLFFREFEPLVS